MKTLVFTVLTLVITMTSGAMMRPAAAQSTPPPVPTEAQTHDPKWRADHPFWGNISSSDAASEAIKAEMRKESEEIEALNKHAKLFRATGRADEAVGIYGQMIDLARRSKHGMTAADAYIGIGDIRTGQKRYVEAADAYDHLWKHGDGNSFPVYQTAVETQLDYVVVLCRAKRFADAYAMYRRVLRENPRILEGVASVPLTITVTDTNYMSPQMELAAHLARGVFSAYRNSGIAVREFEDAVRLRPDSALAHFYLGYAYRDKDLESAKKSGHEYELAAQLGTPEITRRAQQEMGVLPRMTAQEAEELRLKIERRVRDYQERGLNPSTPAGSGFSEQ